MTSLRRLLENGIKMNRLSALWTCSALLASTALAGCGGDDLTCGSGTTKKGTQCVAKATGSGGAGGEAGSSGGSGGTGQAGTAGTGGSGGAPIVDGPPSFAGVEAIAPATATALQVSWKAATDDFSAPEDISYNIYVALSSGMQNFGEPTYVAPNGARSFLLTNLAPDEVFVVVRAVDATGNEDSNSVEIGGTPAVDTAAPTFAGATGAKPAGSTSVEVSWDAADDGSNAAASISYLVYWASGAGLAKAGQLGTITAPGDTTAIVSGLPAADTEFYFHVRAMDAAGNQDDNDVEIAGKTGTDANPPTFGGCAGVANVTASGATLTWAPAKDDVTAPDQIRYAVYAVLGEIEKEDPLGDPVATFTGGTQGVVPGLESGKDYSFVCRALDGSGNEDGNYVIRVATTSLDGSPPVFAGLAGVTAGATSLELTWSAGSDDQTNTPDLIYAAYVSTTAGGQDFTAPRQLSTRGATGMTINGLQSNTQHYVVVRARDQALNEDPNSVEINVKTLVSFQIDVEEAIFAENCLGTGCHEPGNPPQGQVLSPGFAYVNIVDVPAGQNPAMKRIDSTSQDPLDSYLWRKINGGPGITGQQMPPPVTGRVLTPEQIETIRSWIVEGAKNN